MATLLSGSTLPSEPFFSPLTKSQGKLSKIATSGTLAIGSPMESPLQNLGNSYRLLFLFLEIAKQHERTVLL